ncbi:MAG TPA: efflux RND transporter permease subunit, partial [Phycisphaerales bacterium]|nr:efflux RND transporter permease subunit [Phycisphaerales bacterium]
FTPGRPGWQREGVYLTPEGRTLTSDLELASYLREVQDWIIRPQIKGVKDVAGVEAIGGYVKQYHIQPDPMKLVSYGLSFADVIEAVEKNNISTGAGYVEHKGESYLVRATGRIESPEQIERIVVSTRGGVPIRIGDIVARGPEGSGVGIGRELRTGSASGDGEEVVVATAIMLIGANSRTVAAAVDEKMAEVNRSLPAGIRAKTVLNRTKLVDATVATVRKNLLEGALLVVVVLLLLLGNVRAAIICALAIPLSMLMTATGMVQSHVSGNLMSLGAIDFGLIVDGAVIIVENCLRRLAEKQHELAARGETRALTLRERLDVVFDAAKEVRKATAFGEAIIITVYFPLLALTGVEGRMFHPMALTVIFALVAAFILSLTFIPAMVAICITGKVKEREMFLVRWAKAAYAPVLDRAVRRRWWVVGAAVAAFAGSAALFGRLGQEFVPTLDEKDVAMHAMRIASTSLSQSQAMQFDVEKAVSSIPEVAFCYSKTGTAEMATDPMPPNVSDTFIILKPRNQWRSEEELDRLIAEKTAAMERISAHADGHEHGHEHGELKIEGHKGRLIRLIQLTVAEVPGNNYEFTQPIQMRFNELISGVRGDVAVKVYGDDFASMEQTAQRVLGVLQSIPGAADVKTEQTEGLPVMTVDIDREAISRYGLSVHEVQEVVAVAMGGREAGQVFEGDRRFDVVVRLPDAMRGRLDLLERLPIPLPRMDDRQDALRLGNAGHAAGLLSASGTLSDEMGFVPLGHVARIEVAEGMNQISRENGKRRIVVQCNVRGRDLGSFVQEAQAKMAGVQLPAGQWLAWGGQFENLVAAKERLTVVVPVCFFLIFLLLFSTFRSVRYALLVFSAVPLGLTGGVVALWLRGMPFSISAAVGFIALSGVAVLNGLVMVSFINQLRQEGMGRDDAIVRGCLTRLRPVLMTAMVASLGFVPMALARGTGAEVQKPLATVVVGGLVSSTLLTLVVLPALYRIVAGGGTGRDAHANE